MNHVPQLAFIAQELLSMSERLHEMVDQDNATERALFALTKQSAVARQAFLQLIKSQPVSTLQDASAQAAMAELAVALDINYNEELEQLGNTQDATVMISSLFEDSASLKQIDDPVLQGIAIMNTVSAVVARRQQLPRLRRQLHTYLADHVTTAIQPRLTAILDAAGPIFVGKDRPAKYDRDNVYDCHWKDVRTYPDALSVQGLVFSGAVPFIELMPVRNGYANPGITQDPKMFVYHSDQQKMDYQERMQQLNARKDAWAANVAAGEPQQTKLAELEHLITAVTNLSELSDTLMVLSFHDEFQEDFTYVVVPKSDIPALAESLHITPEQFLTLRYDMPVTDEEG